MLISFQPFSCCHWMYLYGFYHSFQCHYHWMYMSFIVILFYPCSTSFESTKQRFCSWSILVWQTWLYCQYFDNLVDFILLGFSFLSLCETSYKYQHELCICSLWRSYFSSNNLLVSVWKIKVYCK